MPVVPNKEGASAPFFILFLPRSGSHMLVSALNSHPEINCDHLDRDIEISEGQVKGDTVKYLPRHNLRKVIYLRRNHEDRIKSLKKLGIERTLDHEKRQEQRHINSLKNVYHLTLNYEDLTQNENIKEIPEKYSNLICDFLNVERMILKTNYRKL